MIIKVYNSMEEVLKEPVGIGRTIKFEDKSKYAIINNLLKGLTVPIDLSFKDRVKLLFSRQNPKIQLSSDEISDIMSFLNNKGVFND